LELFGDIRTPSKTKIFGLGCRLGRPPFDTPIEDQMRYVLLIYDDEKGWAKLSEAERPSKFGLW
jgi:hypothetical protein